MADTVRYMLEDMIPELEDLEEKGYFSKAELREIVKRREHFEYQLKRKNVLKADFLRYIEYETNLGELRRLRKASQGLDAPKGAGDIGQVGRCHFLYERATRKFRGDLRLWMGWLQFCKDSGSTRRISRVVTQALQLHPTAAGLWSYAAAWEFEHNRNAAAARSLMQRGLRVCRGSQQLWVEYFRMELVYAQKLRLRRKILGIEGANGKSAGTEIEGDVEPEETSEAAIQAVLDGAIAKIVFKEAISAMPDNLDFRRQFLDALTSFTFLGIRNIAQDIYATIEADFGGKEEAWDLRARRCMGPLADPLEAEPLTQATAIFDEALQAVPSSGMYDLYAAFLQEQVDCANGTAGTSGRDEGGAPALKGAAKKLAKRVLAVYQRAHDAGMASEDVYQEWPRLALRVGKVKEALNAAEAGCKALPASVPLWSQRITLQLQQTLAADESRAGKVGRKAGKELEEVVLAALQAVSGKSEAADLWRLSIDSLVAANVPLDRLLEQLTRVIANGPKGPMRGGMGQAAADAVERVLSLKGLQEARSLYRQLLKLPSPGGSFFQSLLDIELQEQSADRLSIKQLRQLFEVAVSAHGEEDTELWVRYSKYEQEQGSGIGTVYWRATKALLAPDEFVTRMASNP